MKISLVSRYFDFNCGSAEWIYAAFLRDKLCSIGWDVFEISQRIEHFKFPSFSKKVIHDWIITPIKLIYNYYFCNCKNFFFVSENQAIYAWFINILGGSTVTYFHDIMRIKNKKISIHSIYFNLIYRLAARSQRILVNSSSTRKDLIEYLGVDAHKITIIPPIYRQLKPISKANNHTRKVVGCLGALRKRKRPELLCLLAEFLNSGVYQCPNLEIHIWGKGERLCLLEESASKYESISLKGFAPEEEINKIYASFDYFVMPSKYEGFGLPVIEALMCGVPCFVLSDADIPDEVKSLCIVCKDMEDMARQIHYIENDFSKGQFLARKAISSSQLFDMSTSFNSLVKFLIPQNDREDKDNLERHK